MKPTFPPRKDFFHDGDRYKAEISREVIGKQQDTIQKKGLPRVLDLSGAVPSRQGSGYGSQGPSVVFFVIGLFRMDGWPVYRFIRAIDFFEGQAVIGVEEHLGFR
uniref:Uncharacterized protein n=1 Tax=Candidatus Kentrum sp. FW TaxID=2126338 RepID=A0A450RWK1_9GAMM|nr:MAG: hypothetical protein BECKFW1821A_GA0114235_100454 [Candidatus Kentron sp. FW]